MLTFFRRLRKGLMVSGHARRYILYALGEIALVVVGILIALQINNWNEDRVRNTQIKTYLINLAQSLNDDIQRFKSTRYQNASRVNCFKYILQLAEVTIPGERFQLTENSDTIYWNGDFPQDSTRTFIDHCFENSEKGGVLVINTSVIDEFKNAGLFSFIRNDTLKKGINHYYDRFKWYFSPWRESLFREHMDRWSRFMRDKYSIDTHEFRHVDAPIALIKNHVDIQLEIKEVIHDAWFRTEGATFMSNLASELIISLEEEIENL